MSSSAKDTSKVVDKKVQAKADVDAKAKPKSTLELLEEDDEFEEFDGKWMEHLRRCMRPYIGRYLQVIHVSFWEF
jgi:hypothetical protein